jgi:vitamin B12 transporter
MGEEDIVAPPEVPESIAPAKSSFITVVSPAESLVPRDLGETLQSALGVHVETLGGLGQAATMSIRGASGNQVALFLDGIKLNGATGAEDLSNFPIANFERIEIMRGSYGARFGDAAMGGVVNLVTPRARQGTWANARTTVGIFTGKDRSSPADVVECSGAFGHGAERWQALGTVSTMWTNGEFLYEPDPDLGLGTEDQVRENNGVASAGTLLKGSYALSDDWDVYALTDLFGARKEIPGLVSFPTPQARETDRRLLAAVGTRARFENLKDLSLDGRFTFLGEEVRYEDPGGGTTGFPIRTDNEDTAAGEELTARLPLDSVNVLTVSQNVRGERFSSLASDDHERTTAFLSISDEISLLEKKLSILPQAGVEFASGEDTLAGASLGAAYQVVSWLAIKANGGTGFRRPSFYELYYDQGYYGGNPDLEAERSVSVDVGPALTLDFLEAEVAYFHAWYDDLIVYLLQSGFRYRPYNVGAAEAQGIEIGGKVHLDDTARLEANYTYAEVVDRSGDPSWDGNQVPGKPRNQVFVHGEFQVWGFRPFAEYSFVGANPVTRSNTKMVPSRHLVNAGIAYDISAHVSIAVVGKNLTDDRAADVRGFPLPSRAVYLSLDLRW